MGNGSGDGDGCYNHDDRENGHGNRDRDGDGIQRALVGIWLGLRLCTGLTGSTLLGSRFKRPTGRCTNSTDATATTVNGIMRNIAYTRQQLLIV